MPSTTSLEAELRALIEAQVKQIDDLEKERKLLREQIQYLLNKRFGRSSEQISAGQLDFFGGEAHEPEVVETETVVRKKRKNKPGHGREPFPENLPRNVVQLDLDEEERTCDCGATMHPILTSREPLPARARRGPPRPPRRTIPSNPLATPPSRRYTMIPSRAPCSTGRI